MLVNLRPIKQKITSLLRRLQGRPSPAEAPPIGKIHPFSKMAVIFEPQLFQKICYGNLKK